MRWDCIRGSSASRTGALSRRRPCKHGPDGPRRSQPDRQPSCIALAATVLPAMATTPTTWRRSGTSPADAALAALVDDFEAEQASLMDVVDALSHEQWLLPTRAAGWDVRDQISHLADTDDIALASIRAGPRNLLEEGARYAEQYGNP